MSDNTCGDVLEALSIACECDRFVYDYDPYEYWNALDGQDEALVMESVQRTAKSILDNGKELDGIMAYLKDVVSENADSDVEYVVRASKILIRLYDFRSRRTAHLCGYKHI